MSEFKIGDRAEYYCEGSPFCSKICLIIDADWEERQIEFDDGGTLWVSIDFLFELD